MPRRSTVAGASRTIVLVVDAGVRGDHHGQVAAVQAVGQRDAAQPELGQRRDVRVVVDDIGAQRPAGAR